jgi:hypothetical protein
MGRIGLACEAPRLTSGIFSLNLGPSRIASFVPRQRVVAGEFTRGSKHMWFLFQGLIVFAVCASNILYHWTPNSYLVGLAGMGLAWSLTWLISSLMARPAQN